MLERERERDGHSSARPELECRPAETCSETLQCNCGVCPTVSAWSDRTPHQSPRARHGVPPQSFTPAPPAPSLSLPTSLKNPHLPRTARARGSAARHGLASQVQPRLHASETLLQLPSGCEGGMASGSRRGQEEERGPARYREGRRPRPARGGPGSRPGGCRVGEDTEDCRRHGGGDEEGPRRRARGSPDWYSFEGRFDYELYMCVSLMFWRGHTGQRGISVIVDEFA